MSDACICGKNSVAVQMESMLLLQTSSSLPTTHLSMTGDLKMKQRRLFSSNGYTSSTPVINFTQSRFDANSCSLSQIIQDYSNQPCKLLLNDVNGRTIVVLMVVGGGRVV